MASLQAGRMQAPSARPFGRRAPTIRSRATAVSVRASTGSASNSPPRWAGIYNYLKSNNMRTIPPEEANDMAASGAAVIVDVRPRAAFEKAHIDGSVNVPLFQALDMSNGQIFAKALKWVAYASNGVSPIEPNPNFIDEIKQAAQNGEKTVITVCEAGGTMKPSVNFPEGKASRSLQAAYRAMSEAGLKKVLHLERGVYGWYQAELPFIGEYNPEVGRTPSAAAEPTIKIMSSARGYEMRPDDRQ